MRKQMQAGSSAQDLVILPAPWIHNGIKFENGNGATTEALGILKLELGLDLRELLARPADVTAEEAEIVRAERELQDAKDSGLLESWGHADVRGKHVYGYRIAGGGKRYKQFGPIRCEVARHSAGHIRRLVAKEAAKTAEAEALTAKPEPQPKPAQTICAECKHVREGFLGMLTPVCGYGAKRNDVTGLYEGMYCATKRKVHPGKPCPDYDAKE